LQSDMTMNTTMTMGTAALPKIDAQQFAVMLKQHHDYVKGVGGEQLNLSDAEFVDCDFSGQMLNDIIGARGSVFTRCNFSRADFYGISFQDSTIVACKFNEAKLNKCEFWSVNVSDSTFDDAILIGAEFSSATISDSSFARANLRGGALAQSTLNRCVFDDGDVTGAAISGNKEKDVSWKNVKGHIAKAANLTIVATTAAALAMSSATTSATGEEARVAASQTAAQTVVEKLFFSVVDDLIASSLSDANAVAKMLNTTVAAAGETEHFRTFAGGEKRPIAAGAGLAFTDVEIRQNKQDSKRAILVASLSKSACIARDSVLKKFASPIMTPSNPRSTESQSYVAFMVKGGKLSFGFTQDRPDCVASVVVDRTE
jgi:uncharacterized protein YjbI with pentapeptide repeats